MTHPRVSVLIPSYQHGRFLEECVRSALTSAEIPLEVVVVDDGSTDDSRNVLEKLQSEDPRLRVELQENQGAHAAFARCLDLASGEILFALNSDDAFLPERIPRFLEVFDRKPEVGFLASWLEIIDGGGSRLGIKEAWRTLPPWPRPGAPGLAELEDPALALLETNWISTTSNWAVRRSVLEKNDLRFEALRYTHDWEMFLALATHTEMALVPEALCRYRVHGSNTIQEGEDEGAGAMRFEILWSVARHAELLLQRRAATLGRDPADLSRRFLRAAPRFGRDDILSTLLLLRGTEAKPSSGYVALLDAAHPYRIEAARALSEMP